MMFTDDKKPTEPSPASGLGPEMAQLREANGRLSGLLDAAKLTAIVATDADGLITVFSAGAERMLGYTADEMIGKQTPAIYHLDSEIEARRQALSAQFGCDVRGIKAIVSLASRTGCEEGEWTFVRKDGRHVTVNLALTAIRDSSQKITGYLGIASDITGHKLAESRLKLLAERLSLATSVAAVGVWEWDVARSAMTWDDTMCEIYGFSLGKGSHYEQWRQAVHPDDLSRVEGLFQKMSQDKGRGAIDFRIIR